MSESDFDDLEAYSDTSEWEDSATKRLARSYRIITLAEVSRIQQDLVSSLADSLGVPRGTASILLHKHNWHDDVISEKFFSHPDFLDSLNLSPTAESSLHSADLAMCLICCEENLKGYHLGCGHAVCQQCFIDYTTQKIIDRDVYGLRCPGHEDCQEYISDHIVETISDPFTWRLFLKNKAELYLTTQKDRYCGCPTPNCNLYVEALDRIGKSNDATDKVNDPGIAAREAVVECGCETTFCFLCGQSHLPVSCNIYATWSRLSNDASFIWIESNTKQCPKCMVAIQKNNGCDHMSCRCGHHFCWACLGDFKDYNHRCARYDPKKENDKGDFGARVGARLLHYAPRVSSNLASARFHHQRMLAEKSGGGKVDTVDPLEEFKSPDRLEEGTIVEIHRALAEARSLVAWTLALLFFVKQSNTRVMLEESMEYLELTTRNLAITISSKATMEPKEKLRTRSSYVKSRYNTLLEYVLSNEWEFEPYMKQLLAGGQLDAFG